MPRTTIDEQAANLPTIAAPQWASVNRPPHQHVAQGRPSDLTPEVAAILLEAALEGLSFTHCAGLAGIWPRRLTEWIERGSTSEDEPYYTFARDFKTAEAMCARAALRCVKASTSGKDGISYTHMPWFLQTRFPADYKNQAATETNVNVTTVQVVGLDRLSGDAMAALVSTLEAKVSAK